MANDKPAFLTPEGKLKLESELEWLLNTRRPEVAERIRQAKEEGDLRENAEYDDAKREQGFLEGRIKELEYLLKNAQLITNTGGSVVSLGSTVTIVEDGYEEEETYTVVGATEADPKAGRISNESPLGKTLLGKKKGAKVKVDTPGGLTTFKILKVQ
jgi:transcription elongation factor GreA